MLTGVFVLNHRAVARSVHFGDQSCYLNVSHIAESSVNASTCSDLKNQTSCEALTPQCEWNYSGVGVQYQVSIRLSKHQQSRAFFSSVIFFGHRFCLAQFSP